MEVAKLLKESFKNLQQNDCDKCMDLAKSVKRMLATTSAPLAHAKASFLIGSALAKQKASTEALSVLSQGLEDFVVEMKVLAKQQGSLKNREAAIQHVEKAMRQSIAMLQSQFEYSFKFPRTCHVLNLGGSAVTRDDLLLSPQQVLSTFGNGVEVVLEEKIDGANLGISLDENWRFVLKNRGHTVNSGLGGQWSSVDQWVETHRAALVRVLRGPGQFTLFGEWVALKHSLHYTKLPSYFIAFDIYDHARGSFLSTTDRDACLKGTGIVIIHRIQTNTLKWERISHNQDFNKLEHEIVPLLQLPSAYRDGNLEGIYLKVNDHRRGVVCARGKIVRSDFTNGITKHWSTIIPVKNQLKFESVSDEVATTVVSDDSNDSVSTQGSELLNSQSNPALGTTTQSPKYDTNTNLSWSSQSSYNTLKLPEKYPSTPHLPFSPTVFADDTLMAADSLAASVLIQQDAVVTEKVDGGNCCLFQGRVYARTHRKQATHWSFGRIKQTYQTIWHQRLEELGYGNVALFGENCSAVHSIDYVELTHYFYLFGALDVDQDVWLSWDVVRSIAKSLDTPTVPEIFRGRLACGTEMEHLMVTHSKLPSRVCCSKDSSVLPEGFVIRSTASFRNAAFDSHVAKWVRRFHIQTSSNWSAVCRKAKVRENAFEQQSIFQNL